VLNRLQRIDNIKTYKYRVNVLEKLSYAEVTHIFVRINSGGTRLGNADLTLAQVSSRWRGITTELDTYREKISKLGWELDNSLLLRAMTALLTNQSYLSKLFLGKNQNVTLEKLQAAWEQTKPAMDQAVNFIIHNCLVDRLSLMPTANVLIPLVVFFDRFGANVSTAQARELQRWLYMALIWSRYSGSVETNLDQDIAALAKDQPIQRMIQNIEDKVGRRPVTERELQDQLSNSPYMLIAYVLARRAVAQDWFNGVSIGGGQSLEFHHIFPKALLRERYDLTRDSRTVNQVANLAFLSAKANSRIADQPPTKYLEGIEESRLRAQYVPIDRSLWTLDRFEDFLLERRTMLANAINQLLQSLTDKPALWTLSQIEVLETRVDALEQGLRDLIATHLVSERGELAWKYCIPADIQETVRTRIEQHVKKNPFDATHYDTLAARLENCQFGDYLKIILSNWPLFEDVFGQKQQFSQRFGEVLTARNALKHGKELNASERAFAEGGLIWLEDCFRHAAAREEEDEAQAASE